MFSSPNEFFSISSANPGNRYRKDLLLGEYLLILKSTTGEPALSDTKQTEKDNILFLAIPSGYLLNEI